MLRSSNSTLAWILAGIVSLGSIGCGSSSSESGGVTASMESGNSAPATATEQPGTVEVSTGSPYQASLNGNSAASANASPRPTAEVQPLVLITTSLGNIKVELDSEKAPMTVDNFISYVEDGFYNETVFHYVEQGYMISAGGFKANGQSEETRAYVLNEAHNGLKNTRGTIAMARDPQYKHSAAAQFYFNLVDNPSLDHASDESDETYGYCVFGKVVEGLDVIDKIAAVEVTSDEIFVKRPAQPVVIHSVERVR